MSSLRRHATTLLLVGLALAAAFVVFVLDRDAVSTDEAELRKKNLFEAWRSDEITELVVTTRPEGTAAGAAWTARLTRGELDDAGQRAWLVEVDGERTAADEAMVDQYLGTLEFAKAERRVSAGTGRDSALADPSAEAVDRAALGLDAPRITVTIAMGSRRERLVVGGSAPTPAGASYAEVSGRGVFVITKQLAAALDVPPARFRSRSFVPYLAADLSGLTLEGEGGLRRFVRAPWGGSRGGGFRFAGDAAGVSGARVSAPALDEVLSTLDRMQAEVFLSEEQAQRAATPKVTVTLAPSDPAAKRGVIALGGACPDRPDDIVALRREPTPAAVCVPASTLDPFTRDASGFVDLALIGAPLDEIVEVKLSTGDRALEISRVESEWHLRAPEDRAVPTESGRALVQALLDVRATRLVPLAGVDVKALGLDPPRAMLRVISTPPGPAAEGVPSERVETLEIGAEQQGLVHVRRVEDGAIAELSATSAAALMPSDAALRPAQVFSFDPDRVRSLRIERAGAVQRLRRVEGGAFQLVEPAGEGLAADSGLATELAELLGSLKAERWVASNAGDRFELGAPRLMIEAELDADSGASGSAAEARTARLDLGAPVGAGSFARSGDSPAVFVAPPAIEAAAGRLLLDRAAFVVPPEEVARVTLTPEGGRPVVVEGAPRGWKIAGASDDAAAVARAAAIRDALADLRAEGAVSLGEPEPHQGLSRPRLRIAVELTRQGGAGGPSLLRFAIGAADSFRGTSVYYARRAGVAATYAIAQSRVRPLLEATGAR